MVPTTAIAHQLACFLYASDHVHGEAGLEILALRSADPIARAMPITFLKVRLASRLEAVLQVTIIDTTDESVM